MRDSLRHAATCTHQPLVECPDFKQTFGESVGIVRRYDVSPPIRELRIGGGRASPAVALAALRAAREVTQIMLKV